MVLRDENHSEEAESVNILMSRLVNQKNRQPSSYHGRTDADCPSTGTDSLSRKVHRESGSRASGDIPAEVGSVFNFVRGACFSPGHCLCGQSIERLHGQPVTTTAHFGCSKSSDSLFFWNSLSHLLLRADRRRGFSVQCLPRATPQTRYIRTVCTVPRFRFGRFLGSAFGPTRSLMSAHFFIIVASLSFHAFLHVHACSCW